MGSHMELATIWFFIWGLLWAVYFMTDGFDLGIGAMLPFLARDETDRRIMLNATGPLWDGNEVWLIAAGGVTFAAFPKTYAVLFSAFHEALTLLLLALIVRGVSFEFRSKVDSERARRVCDACQFLGSVLCAILLGVAFANIFKGLALAAGVHQGSLWDLLNPYAMAGGVFFLAAFVLHGALWLAIRTDGALHGRAMRAAALAWSVVAALAVVFLAWTAVATQLYGNYVRHPALFVIPLAAVAALVLVKVFLAKARLWPAWSASAVMIVAVTFFGIVGLYPTMLPSTLDPQTNSITLSQAASGPFTLKVMLGVVILFVPFAIAYQVWAYRLFSGKVDPKKLVY